MAKKISKTDEWAGHVVYGLSGWCLDKMHSSCVVQSSTFVCDCVCHKSGAVETE